MGKVTEKMINDAYSNIENFRDKLGEVFYDEFMKDDNSTYEISKSIINTFGRCQTERDFEIADAMLIAVCGWSFETLLEKIKERDTNGFAWTSC